MTRICCIGCCLVALGMVTSAYAQQGHKVASEPLIELIANGQKQSPPSISLVIEDSTVQWAVNAVARLANLKPLFNASSPQLQQRIRIRLDQMRVMDAFAALLKGTGLAARMTSDGETVMIRPQTQTPSGDQPADSLGQIVGRVVDSASGIGVSEVSVVVQGTRLSVTTGKSGEFVLGGVPVGTRTVMFKRLGFTSVTRTVEVEDKRSVPLLITMKQIANMLAGVVTTATGRQNRREIGSAVTTINVDSVMQVAPIRTLTDLLETRVPGLTIQRTSGEPGDPSRLRLRGSSSISGSNAPVVYIDGIRQYTDEKLNANQAIVPSAGATGNRNISSASAFDQINPNDIERIDVFKGPSATAMFGSDAANGVIMITTKKGVIGPARWDVAVNNAVSYIPGQYRKSIFIYAGIQPLGGLVLGSIALDNIGVSDLLSIDSVVRYQALNDKQYTPFGHGLSNDVKASVSGGSQTLQYRVGLQRATEQGLVKMPQVLETHYRNTYGKEQPGWMKRPDNYKTWSGSGTFTANVSPEMRFTLTSSLYNSEQRKSDLGTQVIGLFMGLPPDSLVDPEDDHFYEKNTNVSLSANHIANFNWNIGSSIPLDIQAGLLTMSRNDERVLPRGIATIVGDSDGRFAIAQTSSASRTVNVRTRLPMGFWQSAVAVGANLEWNTTSQLQSWVNALPSGVDVPTLNLTGRHRTTGQTIFGWYLQPLFAIKSRFFIDPGFRIDNTSLAGSRAKFMKLPKLGMSWVVSDESFFPLKNLFSLLRIRAAFGTSGTQPDIVKRLRLFAVQEDTSASISDLYRGGATVSSLGNTLLRPEASEELEGGFEAELWRGRLNLNLTGYRKTRKDAIVDVPLALSVTVDGLTGAPPSIARNIGVIRNSGLEFSIDGQVFENARLGWRNNISISHNTNRVVRLAAGMTAFRAPSSSADFIDNGETRFVAGYPMNGRWARGLAGFYDVDGNGLIEVSEVVLSDSAVYIGQPEPTMNAVYNSDFSLFHGRVRINTTFAYQRGGVQINKAMNITDRSPNDMARFDSTMPLEQQAWAIYQSMSARHEKVSTLKFETLSMSYQLPGSFAQRFLSRTMHVAIQGRNLGLKTNYSGKDPNVNGDFAGNNNVDDGRIPQPRSWALRITLSN